MPKYLQEVRQLGLAQIGWLGTVGSLGVVVLSLTFGQLPETRRWALVLCQLVALAASVLLLSPRCCRSSYWPTLSMAATGWCARL